MEKFKYILLFAFVFSFSAIFFSSCLDDDDDDVAVDEEWKLKNENEFKAIGASGEGFEKWYSYAYGEPEEGRTNDYIWHRASSEIEVPDLNLRMTTDGYPEFKDSVYCRYEGWYFTKENEKYIFDSTENSIYGSNYNPNKVPIGFLVSGVVEGFRTALQNMKVGDEQEIVIPANLAYGSVARTQTKEVENTVITIPAYTTLYYRVKMLKIAPMKGKN